MYQRRHVHRSPHLYSLPRWDEDLSYAFDDFHISSPSHGRQLQHSYHSPVPSVTSNTSTTRRRNRAHSLPSVAQQPPRTPHTSELAVEKLLSSSIDLPEPSYATLLLAAKKLYAFLSHHHISAYFTGGFCALAVCLSPRQTHDLDVAIDSQDYDHFRDLLHNRPDRFPDLTQFGLTGHHVFFVTDAAHPWGGHFVRCDFVPTGHSSLLECPPRSPRNTVMKEGLCFLAPTELLGVKLGSWADDKRNGSEDKRRGDMLDICATRELLVRIGKKVDVWSWRGRAGKGLSMWIDEFRDEPEWDQLWEPSLVRRPRTW